MYECAICHSEVKIPFLLYLAVPEVKDKGLTIKYELTNCNICKICAKGLLNSMYIDEADMCINEVDKCLCHVNGETILCESSSSSVIAETNVDDNKLEIYSIGDNSSSLSYFPKFCPQCGRAVNVIYVKGDAE